MNKYKSIINQTAIYGLSSILVRVLNFALFPFYSRAIPMVAFGTLSELMAKVAFVNILYMMGMETGFFRFSRSGDLKQEIFATSSMAVMTNAFFLSAIIILASPLLASWSGYEGKSLYFQLLAVTLFVENSCNIPMAKFRLEEKAISYVTVKTLVVVLNLGLNLFFLLYVFTGKVSLPFLSGMDAVEMIFVANLIPWVLAFLYFLPTNLKLASKYNFVKFKEMISYTFPLLVVGCAGMINETFDKIMLKNLLPYSFERNLEELAIYSANYKLGIIMMLVVQAFRMGAEPFFFKESTQKDAPKTYSKIMTYFIIACCAVMVPVSLMRDTIVKMYNESYASGVKIVPLILLANLFLGVFYNAAVWYKIRDKTKIGAVIAIIGAIITLLLNYFLIPTIGYVGSAIATLVCYGSMAAICMLWGRKHYFIPYNHRFNALWIGFSWMYMTIVYWYFCGLLWPMILFSILYLGIIALLFFNKKAQSLFKIES